MSDQCKYCRNTEVEWVEYPVQGWRLINPDGTVHRCAEFLAARQQPAPTHRPKKKSKHGAFLRAYGPRGAHTHAVLVQTKSPDPDTPEGFAAELDAEPRKPAFYHLSGRTK